MKSMVREMETGLQHLARRLGTLQRDHKRTRRVPWETLHVVDVAGLEERGLLRVRTSPTAQEAPDAVLAEHLLARRLEAEWTTLLKSDVRVQPVVGDLRVNPGSIRVKASVGPTELLFSCGQEMAALFPPSLPGAGEVLEADLVLHAGAPFPGAMRLARLDEAIWSVRIAGRLLPVALTECPGGLLRLEVAAGEKRPAATLSLSVRLRGDEAGVAIKAIKAEGRTADTARRRVCWHRMDCGIAVSVEQDRGEVEGAGQGHPRHPAPQCAASDRATILRQSPPRW